MGLDLDEIIYGWTVKRMRKNRKSAEEQLPQRVTLEELKPRLTILARALNGQAIDVYPAEREGGFKNHNFFLPISFSEFADKSENIQFYIYRTLYLTIQRELGKNWHHREDDLKLSRIKALECSGEILATLFERFPGIQPIHNSAKNHFWSIAGQNTSPDLTWLYGKWMYDTPDETTGMLENIDEKVKPNHLEKPETTLRAKAVEDIETKTIDKKQQEDYVLLHSFEKVETAESFNGIWRDFDGSDDLEKHQDALDELSMRFTVRVDEPTHAVYQAEFVENTTISESATTDEKGFHLTYPEWDYKKSAYRQGFCKVYPKTQLKTHPDFYHKTLQKNASTLMELRKMLTSLNNKMQMQRRQRYGEDLDIDALTDFHVDVQSKRTPDENVYLANRKRDKDISILMLLDLSLSSDGFAGGNRVIEVEKEVSILFGEILYEFNIDFSIDGFYSKTRNYSNYISLKSFEEDWIKVRNRIGAAEPGGYTRIGAALRHAGARMDMRNTKNKWIILLSDGKPNDFDRYEGKHGIQDVKQALRELNERKINAYALAIEAQAKYYLPQMFGQNHYQILTKPRELLTALVKLYEKIKHQ
ncbi:MAG: VWA domain-containing protein [Cryomorphaceae bacterium]|nr:VWA domain-containing protein [Cryomorphaceae bacterium]